MDAGPPEESSAGTRPPLTERPVSVRTVPGNASVAMCPMAWCPEWEMAWWRERPRRFCGFRSLAILDQASHRTLDPATLRRNSPILVCRQFAMTLQDQAESGGVAREPMGGAFPSDIHEIAAKVACQLSYLGMAISNSIPGASTRIPRRNRGIHPSTDARATRVPRVSGLLLRAGSPRALAQSRELRVRAICVGVVGEVLRIDCGRIPGDR